MEHELGGPLHSGAYGLHLPYLPNCYAAGADNQRYASGEAAKERLVCLTDIDCLR